MMKKKDINIEWLSQFFVYMHIGTLKEFKKILSH